MTAFLFPSSVTGVLGILAQIGLIFFMFLIGLELDRTQIRGSGHTAILISHYSIVIPLVLGMASALLVFPLVGSGTFTGFALFMGAAMAITAFPVLARILTDTGLHKTRIGALAITCAAVDDVTAWCVLAIVVAIVNAAGPIEAVTTIALSLTFVFGMLFVVRPLAERVMTAHKGRGPLSATVLSFLIVGLFLSAWTTEMIGIHAIFGAFIFGAILPRERGVATGIIERLEDVTVLVLLPIFFAVVGLSTQIGLVSGRELWLLTGLIIAIAIIGKIGGSIIAGLAAGESLRTSSVIGVLMNARGITEIVILTIGIELGVISPALFTIMVLMALTTTIMTTPLLSRLYPRSMVEREILLEHHRDAARGDYGSRRVMVGVTDPVTVRPLVQIAGWLRGADGQAATVVLASVIAPPGHEQVRANIGEFAATSARAAANLSAVADELDQRNVRSEVVTRIGTDRGEELRLICQQQDIDVIVVGSHLAYLHRAPFGGLVGELIRTAPSDVLVAVNAAPALAPGGGPIGVWLPGEPTDLATVDLASSLARGLESPLRVIGANGTVATVEADEVIEMGVDATAEGVVTALDGVAMIVLALPFGHGALDVEVVETMTTQHEIPVLVLRTAPALALDRTSRMTPYRRASLPIRLNRGGQVKRRLRTRSLPMPSWPLSKCPRRSASAVSVPIARRETRPPPDEAVHLTVLTRILCGGYGGRIDGFFGQEGRRRAEPGRAGSVHWWRECVRQCWSVPVSLSRPCVRSWRSGLRRTGGRIQASGVVGPIPSDLSEFVDHVAVAAWRVTSEEVAALLDAGYTEDEVFEVTVSASMGAACGRLERGLAALRGEV